MGHPNEVVRLGEVHLDEAHLAEVRPNARVLVSPLIPGVNAPLENATCSSFAIGASPVADTDIRSDEGAMQGCPTLRYRGR